MNLITRFDFDGIVSAVMIYKMENIADISFSDPKFIEEGEVLDLLNPGDIIAHLPFHPDAGMWFHNHDTSQIDPELLKNVKGKYGEASSTSRQVFEYYNSPDLKRYVPIIKEVDRIATADLTKEDITAPKGWIMVAYTVDPRFYPEHTYAMMIMNSIMSGKAPEEILQLPPVAKRVQLYQADEERYVEELKKNSRLDGKVIITDFREVARSPRGNRFTAFVHFPAGNVQIRLQSGAGNRVKVSIGKSIFNRTCKANIGHLMEEYGGGGMAGAGTCVVSKASADEKLKEIVKKLNI